MGFCDSLEACCCGVLTYFPLAFVYSITTWAAWVMLILGFSQPIETTFADKATSILGLVMYLMVNIAYTTAVFTSPGTPLHRAKNSDYSSLPTTEPAADLKATYSSLTAKSTGQPRFCKKCQTVKPDRAHHCSTCGRCVLKMDHHCPWLATCVGLHNYKAFILFIGYTSLYCWLSFFKSAAFVWTVMADDDMDTIPDARSIINAIVLTVIGGVLGLTLTMFTGFHISLVINGQTTIESLEKTRYLGPVKRNMESQIRREKQRALSGVEHAMSPLDTLKKIHANALPGVTRPEEGIEDDEEPSASPSSLNYAEKHAVSPAQEHLRRTYAERELRREQERYANYLDERDSESLPHAFDLGWRRNFSDVFGRNMLLWFVPVMNSPGDGWRWDVSDDWSRQCDNVLRERSTRQQRLMTPGGQHTLPSPLPVPSGPDSRSWSRGRESGAPYLGRRTAHASAHTPQDAEPPYHDHHACANGGHEEHDEQIDAVSNAPRLVATPRPRSGSGDRPKGD